MQNRVFVLDKNKKPLAPCHPARARILLKKGRASVYRYQPFTIILHDRTREESDVQPIEVKVDPGSRITGMALVLYGKRGARVVWAAELHHRGHIIKKRLDSRRAVRRSRRSRKTRYRKPRFKNRKRQGRHRRNGFDRWLPPSLQSRVDNIDTWVGRLVRWAPVCWAAVETAKFDTQKMQNPEISGVEYQRGGLAGCEIREYLLEKWGRRCAYCNAQDVPLEVEHIVPRSRGGSNRVSNLTLACCPCNQAKGNRPIEEFLTHDPKRLARILRQCKQSLKDTAIVNATRYAIGDAVKTHLHTTFWTGGRTKFNRMRQGYPKTHWIDAACVGESGAEICLDPGMQILQITAAGRGRRQMCMMDRFGFPRTKPKAQRQVHGFKTGDLVRAMVPRGKKAGMHIGRVVVRAKGSFQVGSVDGISWRYCQMLQRADGYAYGNSNARASISS